MHGHGAGGLLSWPREGEWGMGLGRDAVNDKDYPIGYMPSVDGIRGVLPFGVLAAHIQYRWFPGAIVFMNVFFILSAYLITSLLLRDIDKYGKIRFKIFYTRRFLRLFPAYYVLLAIYCLVSFLLLPDTRAHYLDALYAGLYVSNWTRAFDIKTADWLGHTWSLSIEEQFYLCWPVLFSLLAGWLGFSRRILAVLVAAMVSFAAWRFWLASDGASIARLYNGTDVRADTLLVGCIVAVVFSRKIGNPALLARIGRMLFVPLAILIFFVFGFTLHWQTVALYTWGTTLIDVCVGVFLIGLVTQSGSIVHRVFESKVLVYLGKLSYSTYLWHYPIFQFMREYQCNDWQVALYGVPLTYGFAWLSYTYIEKPFILLKRKYV